MHRRQFIKTAGAGAVILAAPDLAVSTPLSFTNEEIEKRVQETIAKMSLNEKIFQMCGRVGRDVLLGASQILTGSGHGYAGYTPAVRRLGIPALKCVDGPRGVGFFYTATAFPVGLARGASWDPELEEKVGAAMGYETRAIGANQLLAPCINVIRHPSWGRSQESYGEDPFHLGVLGAASVRGIQKHAMSCPKHYAVNNIDESRNFVNAIVGERTLREIYLPHFKDCVEAGAASVMSAVNDVNGELVGHNDHLIRDILKGDWEFMGFVISDWLNAVEDTVEAANAGLDVEMPRPEHYDQKLKLAVMQGKVSMEVIDDAVARILRAKFRWPDDPSGYDKDRIAGPEHTALARVVEEESMVLLKNDDILPLDLGKIRKIAVIGQFSDTPTIGDIGSSNVTPPYIITPLQGIKNLVGSRAEVVHGGISKEVTMGPDKLVKQIMGIHDEGADATKENDIERALKAVEGADVVIIAAGLDYRDEGEGNDREDLNLNPSQEALIEVVSAVNKNCVVVLEGGGVITMERWIDKVPAIVMAWYPGMEGGNAIANVLFGKVNPSGKLPLVFPRALDQLFEFDNKAKEVKIDYCHGYRYMEKQGLEPQFHFGYGLSYTTFKFDNLRLSPTQADKQTCEQVKVSVDVTNTGGREGKEVVQLYVSCLDSAVDRTVKDLKGFKKVSLAPGETKKVEIVLPVKCLAYYDVDEKDWIVESGNYRIMVGPSSRQQDLLSADFRLD